MLSNDEGSVRAPIVVVGEAYGHWEEVYGRPFVGPSYTDKMLPCWNACEPTVQRSDCYITNAWDQGQPGGRIEGISETEMRASFQRLHERLAKLEGPDGDGPMVIVPQGNYALYALTGKGVVSFHVYDGRWKRPGILDWRGSILSYTDLRGRTIKVIPVPHPAALFRQPHYEWVFRKDWQRVATDAKFRGLDIPRRTRMIAPSKAELVEYLRWTRSEAAKRAGGDKYFGRLACSLDVETPNKVEYETKQTESKSQAPGMKCRGCGHTMRWHSECAGVASNEPRMVGDCRPKRGKKTEIECACVGFQAPLGKPKKIKISEEPYLGCIGWSWDSKLSMTAPTTLEYWQDPAVMAMVMGEIRAFHADPNIDFGGQNFGFDCWWCAEENIPVRNQAWDLMKMHRVERPWSHANDLAFQASLDTREPFWKHESKLPDEISRWSHNKEQLWSYNGTDNCVQIELLTARVNGLKAAGRLEYYETMEAPIDSELLVLSRWGIRADEDGRKAHFEKVKTAGIALGKEINAAAGMPADCKHKKCNCLVKKISVSATTLKRYLYETLRLPPQYRKNAKKEKVISVDVVTLKRLMEQFPSNQALQEVGKRVLTHRRLGVEANFVKEEGVGVDGRVRAIFRQDTALGRLKSSKTPKRVGSRNLQNIDRKLRRFFLPDTGDEIVP